LIDRFRFRFRFRFLFLQDDPKEGQERRDDNDLQEGFSNASIEIRTGLDHHRDQQKESSAHSL